jgi:hypothetical protein
MPKSRSVVHPEIESPLKLKAKPHEIQKFAEVKQQQNSTNNPTELTTSKT